MLLRFCLENFGSFKEAVEFNTFPSSKSHSHDNHKVVCNHATALRMGAIYGANGAGKSNLLMAIRFLHDLVERESINAVNISDDLYFRFDEKCRVQPSAIAIEFYCKGSVFYYSIEFDRLQIYAEELLLCQKTKDVKIFSRRGKDIEITSSYASQLVDGKFVDMVNRLLRPDMLLLSFFGKYYPTEVELITDVYSWFVNNIEIVHPDACTGIVPHLIDVDDDFAEMVNSTIPELKTGIARLQAKKEIIDENDIKDNPELAKVVKKAKENPGIAEVKMTNNGNDFINIVNENGYVWKKWLVCTHVTPDGTNVEMPLYLESDGTRRLIEYMPLLYAITRQNKVYIVDEIERSIHPIMIKDLMRKLSESETATGQLIFTTHESSLLDQSIFRPDEIWFAQKDVEQATQLYPLSDFNIHKTANIENGYLNGRYGGIPFLSNLKDLHW